MLKIQGLKKKFGNFEALSGLDMEVEEGALYGFVGPNGAGKTTAIRIITGLLKADEGTVMIGGKDAFLYSGQVKNEFGYVPDEFGLYDNLKVWEYMDFFASCYGLSGLVARERCTKLLEHSVRSARRVAVTTRTMWVLRCSVIMLIIKVPHGLGWLASILKLTFVFIR